MDGALGTIIIAEQHLENVGAGDLALRGDLGMKAVVLTHVFDQFGVFQGFRLVRTQQLIPKVQLLQTGQNIVHRVVHRVHGVDQGRVPVEQDHARFRVRQMQDAHAYFGGRLSGVYLTLAVSHPE